MCKQTTKVKKSMCYGEKPSNMKSSSMDLIKEMSENWKIRRKNKRMLKK